MSVPIWVGPEHFELASTNILLALYSTIAVRLENRAPGSRFPVIMERLLESGLSPDQADAAITELTAITEELRALSAEQVVWDWERPEWQPTWADRLTTGASHLEHVFMSSDGKALLEVYGAVAQACKRRRRAAEYP